MQKQFFTIVILTIAFNLNAQGPWTQKTDMPTRRWAQSSIAMDGKIYVIGGIDSAGYKQRSAAFKTTEVYDPVTDTWASKAGLITGRSNFATCILQDKILTVGGSKYFYTAAINTIEEYDPVADSWTFITNMPRARIGPSATIVDGKIYIIGGGDSNLGTIGINDVYDTLTKTWSRIADIPTPRINLQAYVVNEKIYVLGGMTGASSGEKGLTTLEEYDPSTDTWTEKASMSLPRKYFDACVIDGRIYVFGGTSGYCSPALSGVEEYDPVTDTWTQRAGLPVELAVHSVAQMNGKAYIIGGSPGGNPNACSPIIVPSVYEYNPLLDLFPLIEKIEVNKNYVMPGNDSIRIAANLRDTTGISLIAVMEDKDKIPIDSLTLYDDGIHNDGAVYDSHYANVWLTNISDEQNYSVGLKIIKTGSDTITHYVENIALLTSIGPVNGRFFLTGTDIVPNPNDQLRGRMTLKNNGSVATAKNIKAKLTSSDTLVLITDYNISYNDIPAGDSVPSKSSYTIYIYDEHPVNTEVPVIAQISSNDYVFWTDTFSIRIEPPNPVNTIEKSVTRIYPNPVVDELTIYFDENWITNTIITLCDITGKIVYSEKPDQEVSSSTYTIDLSSFGEGLYFINISNEQYSVTEKVIKVE